MSELLNAITMLPAYGLLYYVSCSPILFISILLYPTISFLYHLSIHYQSSYKPILFKLDILSQQFVCYCLTTHNLLPYFILSFMAYTSIHELESIRPYIVGLNGFLFIGVSYPHLDTIGWWMITFSFFILHKKYNMYYGHSCFHLLSHMAMYSYLSH